MTMPWQGYYCYSRQKNTSIDHVINQSWWGVSLFHNLLYWELKNADIVSSSKHAAWSRSAAGGRSYSTWRHALRNREAGELTYPPPVPHLYLCLGHNRLIWNTLMCVQSRRSPHPESVVNWGTNLFIQQILLLTLQVNKKGNMLSRGMSAAVDTPESVTEAWGKTFTQKNTNHFAMRSITTVCPRSHISKAGPTIQEFQVWCSSDLKPLKSIHVAPHLNH